MCTYCSTPPFYDGDNMGTTLDEFASHQSSPPFISKINKEIPNDF